MKFLKTMNVFLNEGFAANSAFSKMITFLKKHPDQFKDWNVPDEVIKNITDKIKSDDIFKLSAIFPRESFKIGDIVNGRLAARIKLIYFVGEEQEKELEKVEILKNFVQSMDAYFGDRSWLK